MYNLCQWRERTKRNTTTLRHAKMQPKLTVDHNALKLPEYNFRAIN